MFYGFFSSHTVMSIHTEVPGVSCMFNLYQTFASEVGYSSWNLIKNTLNEIIGLITQLCMAKN